MRYLWDMILWPVSRLQWVTLTFYLTKKKSIIQSTQFIKRDSSQSEMSKNHAGENRDWSTVAQWTPTPICLVLVMSLEQELNICILTLLDSWSRGLPKVSAFLKQVFLNTVSLCLLIWECWLSLLLLTKLILRVHLGMTVNVKCFETSNVRWMNFELPWKMCLTINLPSLEYYLFSSFLHLRQQTMHSFIWI